MRKSSWVDCVISLGEMHLRRERKIPNSKGRVNPNSLKWHGEKKHVQRHLKMNKIKL